MVSPRLAAGTGENLALVAPITHQAPSRRIFCATSGRESILTHESSETFVVAATHRLNVQGGLGEGRGEKECRTSSNPVS